ncbi:MAG TPA: hypothetical protein VD704_00455 [Gaiellaceae bacterium]|nr:hypothetical protein [Gaiellaceae bacterium]
MRVTVCDVGPRDGLRNEQAVPAPSLRAELANLHGEGVETGVDLDALIGVPAWLETVLGRELPGQLDRAGAFAPASG